MKKFLDNFDRYASGILLITITVLVCLQVFFRYVLNSPLAWTEDWMVYTFCWLIYMAAAACVKTRGHLQVDLLYDRLPQGTQKIVTLLNDIVWLGFSLVMVYSSFVMVKMQYTKHIVEVASKIPTWVGYFAVTFGMGLMAIRLLFNIVEDVKNLSGKEDEK